MHDALVRNRITTLSLLALAHLAVACGGTDGAQSSTETPAVEERGYSEPETPVAGGSCGDATDCASCVAIDGCNWTAGQCARECAMDTYCIGPGNPGAECSHGVVILGDWQEDMASAHDGVRVFVRADVELGPARFRRTMTFWDATEDSAPVFRTNVLAPNDAHGTAEGSWQVEDDLLTVRYRPDGAAEDTVEQYDVVSSSAQRLELRAR